MTAVEPYRWIVDDEQSYLAMASCVTIVRGLDVARTVSAFGGDPSAEPEPLETLSLARGVLGEGVADEVRRQISRPSPPC